MAGAEPYKQQLISAEDVAKRIQELAAEIVERYKGQNPLFVCLLRGGAPFATRLMFAIAECDDSFHPELDYMTIKTYDERQDTPPKLILDVAPITDIKGRPVILLDDVLDKGLTAQFAHDHLIQARQAKSVDLVVLIQKTRKREQYQAAMLYGFEGPEDWLSGMGMDDTRIAKEANRWLNFVAVAND